MDSQREVWFFSVWQAGHLGPTLHLANAFAALRKDVKVCVVGAEEHEDKFPSRHAELGKPSFRPGYRLPDEYSDPEKEKAFWSKCIRVYTKPEGIKMFSQ